MATLDGIARTTILFGFLLSDAFRAHIEPRQHNMRGRSLSWKASVMFVPSPMSKSNTGPMVVTYLSFDIVLWSIPLVWEDENGKMQRSQEF